VVFSLSNIRVTYSGLISFIVSITSVLTGTVFVVMVTRKLLPEELGLWTLITSLVSYVLIVEPIISYWTTRQIARGEQVGKTSLFTGSLLSIPGIVVFFIIAFSLSLEIDFNLMVLAAVLVPIRFLHEILNGIAHGYKPHSISFGNLAFEISKIPVGLLFIVFLQFGIIGAFLTIIASSLLRLIILLIMLREQLIGKIKSEVIKFWFRMSWIPMYGAFAGFIFTLDVIIFSSLTNSLVGLAYWTAGITIATLISQSGSISQALYPKLIATGKKEYAEENFKRTLFLAIPILAVSIILAKPLLHIINPIYTDGTTIVYFLTMKSFVVIFASMAFNISRAFEKVDLDKNASFRSYLKSKLFFIPTISYITAGIYVVALSIFLLIRDPSMSEIDLVSIWALIFFLVLIPTTIYVLILIRKNHQINLPYVHILKFLGATILASIPVYFMSVNMLTYSPSIFDFLPQVILIVSVGAAIYFVTTYIIDQSTRTLIHAIIREIRKKS